MPKRKFTACGAIIPDGSAIKQVNKSKLHVAMLAVMLLLCCGYYSCSDNGKDNPDELTLEQLTEKAEKGKDWAQCALGKRYFDGDGVAKDYAEAVRWLRKAAEQGHAEAECYLGECYVHGVGVPQDMDEAAKWIRKAAEQGEAEAQYCLGLLYYNGAGVSQNQKEAVKWLKKAADQGYELATTYMEQMGLN
ncbi:MAG: sel1 repeat family protein [Prevotellaceae bacterium]|nr:sel1 repeat family protein [Prevotellaceae bacterium]